MKTVFGALSHVDVLAIGVHPDDVELSACATLLKHQSQGYSVAILDLTEGELGTRGNAEIRLQESKDAAKLLDLKFRLNLGLADGFFRIDKNNILKVAQVIRDCRPTIILANALNDRHPDHGRAAELVREAYFFSGLSKIGELKSQAYRASALYHYIQDKNVVPDLCIDVTGFELKKMEAILCYKSQFHHEEIDGPETPISSKQFLEFIMAKMKTFGRSIGVDYAEGFNIHRTMGCTDLHHLI